MRPTGHPPLFGIDFGTTNSAVALLEPGGEVRLARFSLRGQETPACRSVLYFEQHKSSTGMRRVHGYSGLDAIERYLDAEEKGRLIQSLKSHLPSRSLTGTEVFGRRHRIEELVARILTDLRKHAEAQFGHPIRRATVGRPVRFVGAESEEDDDFAVARLREAFTHAGFEEVEFELEPVGAAYAYEATLDRDELILIGDFGGGTSDFSLLRVGPGVRRRGRRPDDLLGNSGVGLAGDAFDARIIRKLVSPALGSNSEARSLNKILPAVPAWIYANLERWHYLSFLRTNNVRETLKSALARALEPEKIEALIAVIDGDLGYQLHQAVQQVKFELSQSERAEFRFRDGGIHGGAIDLRIPVTRAEFETWIADDLAAIEHSVDALLRSAGVSAGDVDRVFLTGGSSFVPAVRRIFITRFGQEKLRGGNEFTSVAQGLALRAAANVR
ncbi:Hsp70 family protein [Occallatibacter riparius]|uniref:Hsp70 family protein n=1 Tax=Occallatibacter riparius TaxID=1002689 RepID=A0A9J7BQZ9_9BACT|nr:Hsp70 family protein [Occallatibacter riparius]UWZ85007.1 Hsp70 family protein [Occallatibacter riparius]